MGPLGLNATPLLTPLTGIGRYTRHLALELGELLPESPWLFYASDWSREVRDSPPGGAPGTLDRLKGAVPFAYEMARAMQQRHFSRGVREHRIALYHEPNYLAFHFEGPTVVTVHDLSWVRHPETHPPERVRAMERMMPAVVSRAAHIVTDSEFVRAEIVAHYGIAPDRVSAVPLGVDAELAPCAPAGCAAALHALGLEYGRYCLALGTLEPRKNLGAVIEAHAGLPDALRARFPLAIGGMSGWGEASSPAREASVARGEVRMLGYVPQALLPALYSGARLLVYPSLYEGFGLPPLEAMACATPVVVSRRASLPEVVGDAGILVEPLDTAAIGAAIRALMEDDACRERLGQAGLDRARSFTWRRCAERTVDAYARALAHA